MKRERCQDINILLKLTYNSDSVNYWSPKFWVRTPFCPCFCFVFIWPKKHLLAWRFLLVNFQWIKQSSWEGGETTTANQQHETNSPIQWNSCTIFCLIFGQRQDKFCCSTTQKTTSHTILHSLLKKCKTTQQHISKCSAISFSYRIAPKFLAPMKPQSFSFCSWKP